MTREDLDVYRTNVSSVLQAMGFLCKHLKAMYAEGIGLLTKTQILGRSSTVLGWLMKNVTQVHYPRDFAREVEEERAKLLAELEDSRQQSRQRLMAIEGVDGDEASNGA